MNIRLFITVCCFALIQFQGRAAVMQGYYEAPSVGEAGELVDIVFNYTIVTPNPDYILYFPFMGVPFSIPPYTTNYVGVNGTLVPFTVTSFSASAGLGIYIKLQDPSLAVVGAQIFIGSNLILPTIAGQYPPLGSIKTATSDGTTIDYTTGFPKPFIIIPKRVTFLPTTAITNNSFTLNWFSSQGADSYHLDVSTSPTFSTFVTGYSNLNVGTALTYFATGLSPNTTYYVRLTSYFQTFSSPNPATTTTVLTSNSAVLPATVSLSNLTATYNGSTHAATATTTPAGLTVVTTYNGSITIPTNAGTYAIVATVSDVNYQGTTSGSLVISKATANPVLGNLTKTYNGTPQVFTATTAPAGLNVIKTYNGSITIPTNAGTYAVVATVNNANYQGSTTGSLIISKVTTTVSLSKLTATYNGTTHAVTATTVPAGLTVGLTYNGSSSVPTNAGTYAVVSTISDANYQGTTSGSLVISKATVNPVLGNLTKTYNGTPQIFTATTSPSNLNVSKTYNGFSSIPTNAGTYTVEAIVSDPNYQGTTSGSLVISKATATLFLSNLTATFDGSSHAATTTTVPAGLAVVTTYNGSNTAPTLEGTYAVVAIINDENYQDTASGSLEIKSISTSVPGNV